MVENLDLLIASVVHVYVFLLPVGRKANPPSSAPIVRETVSSLDPDIILEVSHLIEHLDPVGLPVTDIDQAVVADDHTMHDLHECTTDTGIGLFFCPLVPPLTKEFPGSIENNYPAIAVTVSYVDVAVSGINRYVGRHVELRVTRVQCPTLESAVGSIDNASFPDLHQQFSIVTVFLDDSIAIACSPKIVLIVNGAAVGNIRNDFPVAKAIHHIAVGIEFNVGWRLLCNFRFLVRHVITIDDEDVILCVHAYTADLSDYPFFWQRLWPVRIDNELRTAALRLRPADYSQGCHQAYAKPNLSETPYFFLHFASHFSTSFACDGRDLDVSTQGQLGDLHGRSRGQGILEVPLVDGVHFLELRQIDEIDLNRSDIGVVHVRIVQNAPDIFQGVSDLLAEIGWQCIGFRVRSLQTRDVQSVRSQDSRTVGRASGDQFRADRSVAGLRRRRKEHH